MHAQHNANAGTKGAAKAMNKIAQGPLYREGTTWFRQLSDKRMSVSCHTVYIHVYVHVHIHGIYRHVQCTACVLYSTGRSTKTHLYWAMKNCDGTGSDLQKQIMNIIPHYQAHVRVYNYCHFSNVVLWYM